MKSILEKWKGCFDISGYISKDLKEFNPKDGDEFHIKLLTDSRGDISSSKVFSVENKITMM